MSPIRKPKPRKPTPPPPSKPSPSKPQRPKPAHVTDCKIVGWGAHGAGGGHLSLEWTYGPGQIPKFLSITVFGRTPDGTDWDGVISQPPGEQPGEVMVNPGSVSQSGSSGGFADVSVFLFLDTAGTPVKIVFTGNMFKAANLPLGGQKDEFPMVIPSHL